MVLSCAVCVWKKFLKKGDKGKEKDKKKGKEKSKGGCDTEMDGGYNEVSCKNTQSVSPPPLPPADALSLQCITVLTSGSSRTTKTVSVCSDIWMFCTPSCCNKSWTMVWDNLFWTLIKAVCHTLLMYHLFLCLVVWGYTTYRRNILTSCSTDYLMWCMSVCMQSLKDECDKETELSDNEPEEDEKLGRLHFTLDYNFTDNTVSPSYSLWCVLPTICQLSKCHIWILFFSLSISQSLFSPPYIPLLSCSSWW